jgi:hypothetical protein
MGCAGRSDDPRNISTGTVHSVTDLKHFICIISSVDINSNVFTRQRVVDDIQTAPSNDDIYLAKNLT